MLKTLIGRNDDLSPHYLYVPADDEIALFTGKIVADITLDDGTTYDVTDPFVGVKDHHHDALVNAIGDWYETYGHPDLPDGVFKHDKKATANALKAWRALRDPKMALLSPAAQSLAINAVLAGGLFIGCHTASPGTTGANEYAGVTRQAVTWTTSSAGSAGTNVGALSFTTSGATAVSHMVNWSASSAGNPMLGFVLGSSVQATTITVAAGALSSTSS